MQDSNAPSLLDFEKYLKNKKWKIPSPRSFKMQFAPSPLKLLWIDGTSIVNMHGVITTSSLQIEKN